MPVEKIAFPFLHIKLGLFQKYLKALDKGSDCFKFTCRNIKKSEVKLLNGVFIQQPAKSLYGKMNNLNDLESIEEGERSSSISENYEDYEPHKTQKSNGKWSTNVPVTLVTKGNLSTRKEAKILESIFLHLHNRVYIKLQ